MILHPLPPALQLQLQSHPQFVAAKSLIPVPPKIIYNSSYVGLHVTVSDFFEKFAETFLYHGKERPMVQKLAGGDIIFCYRKGQAGPRKK